MVVAIKMYDERKDSVLIYLGITSFERLGTKIKFGVEYGTRTITVDFDFLIEAKQVAENFQNALVRKGNYVICHRIYKDNTQQWLLEEAESWMR